MENESENVDELVGPEMVEEEFMRWVEAMDLDHDLSGMDDEDKKSLESQKRIMFRSMARGHLVVTEEGDLLFTPQATRDVEEPGKPIRFKEPKGGAFLAMDKKKKNHDVSKTHATLAEMTGQPMGRYAKMASRNLRVCHAVVALFLG